MRTVFAAPTQILAVERHDDAVWLCAVGSDRSTKLARFADLRSVETYRQLIAQRMAYAHEAGRMGL